MNSSTLDFLCSFGESLNKGLYIDLPIHGITSYNLTIPPLIVQCLSHVLVLIGSKLNHLSSTHPHGKQDLIDLIMEVLRVFIHLGFKEHQRIHPLKIS